MATVCTKELRFIDLFCGIGGFRYAFERAGGECVFSSDWNEPARITYAANHGERPHGDIHLEFHPAGEVVAVRRAAAQTVLAAPLPVDTHGRRFHVEWDPAAPVTPLGQLVFFSQFLATAGLFHDWVKGCPLQFHRHNAPELTNLPGTIALAMLAGQHRYSHVAALRADTVGQAIPFSVNSLSIKLRAGLDFHVEVDFSGFPIVAGFAEERRDQAEAGFFIGKDAGDAGAAFEFLVDAFPCILEVRRRCWWAAGSVNT